MSQNTFTRPLRAALAYVANFMAALFGTAIIESSIWRLLGNAATPNGMVVREILLSTAISFSIAVVVCRRWPTRGALWIWVAPVTLMFLRAISFVAAGPSSVLAPGAYTIWSFFGLDVSHGLSALAFRNYTLFIIPTVRTLAYSGGAIVATNMTRRNAMTAEPEKSVSP